VFSYLYTIVVGKVIYFTPLQVRLKISPALEEQAPFQKRITVSPATVPDGKVTFSGEAANPPTQDVFDAYATDILFGF
jgi:hypothetical protein